MFMWTSVWHWQSEIKILNLIEYSSKRLGFVNFVNSKSDTETVFNLHTFSTPVYSSPKFTFMFTHPQHCTEHRTTPMLVPEGCVCVWGGGGPSKIMQDQAKTNLNLESQRSIVGNILCYSNSFVGYMYLWLWKMYMQSQYNCIGHIII